MLQSYKDKKCCVVDNGIFEELAVSLSKHYGEVYYHTPWREAYPKRFKTGPGEGVPGIKRIDDIDDPDFQKKIDQWVFPDLYWSGYQKNLIERDFRVWGSRDGEQLELYRKEATNYFKKIGLPVGKFKMVKGVPALREYLKTHNDVYVKLPFYRGEMETKSCPNYKYVEPWLNHLEHSIGIDGLTVEFYVQDKLDAVAELGYDGFNVWGQWPKEALVGLEVKDKTYFGHVVPYKDMPKELTEYTEKISDTLKKYKYANHISTENRILADHTSVMNDACQRLGSPPSELYINMIDNLPDIYWYGSEGKLIEPEWNAPWGCEVIIDSTWHEDLFWQQVEFPEKYRDNVKLHHFKVIDGEYYVLPYPNTSVGAIVATGKSMEEARENCKKICDEVKGDFLEIHSDYLDDAEESIENLKKHGVKV